MGKQYGTQTLFRGLELAIEAGSTWLIKGANGTGKSTLLKILAGYERPTWGSIGYTLAGHKLDPDQLALHLSWYGPYIGRYSQLKLQEWYGLHFRFRPCLLGSAAQCLEATQLSAHGSKRLSELSSGMLQRAAVGLALFTQSSLLLLDEPTSNMDSERAEQTLGLIDTHLNGRTLVLASNLEREQSLCKQCLPLASN